MVFVLGWEDRVRRKLFWLDQVRAYVQAQLGHYPNGVKHVDFNVAPDNRDVYNPVIAEFR
jgi:exodeoxyribonuclease III